MYWIIRRLWVESILHLYMPRLTLKFWGYIEPRLVNIYSFKRKSDWIGGGGVGGDGGGGALVSDETQNLLLSAELLKWIYLGEDIKKKKNWLIHRVVLWPLLNLIAMWNKTRRRENRDVDLSKYIQFSRVADFKSLYIWTNFTLLPSIFQSQR